MTYDMWDLKRNDTDELTLKNRNRLTDFENERTVARGGKDGGRDSKGMWDGDMYTLLYLKWITNKVLLYSIGNSAQRYVAAWMGGEFGREWIHVYMHG